MSTSEDSQPILPTSKFPELLNGQVQKPQEAALTTVPKASLQDVLAGTAALATTTTTYPSQIVTYYSKYVDKLSDVSSNMNVSGSLSIRYGEISGGASGSFVDVESFQDSDINFMISVKVVNQHTNVKDQLMFVPLDADDQHPPSDAVFTQTYGDSFISGFQEGGQFFAIVSIKALDSSQKMEIKASAQLALQVGVGDVSGNADVEIAKANLQKNSQVNITVNWSGGGQLKEGNEKWDIDTLTEVAVRFPDLVAQCPQRTHAILTKYTALRDYLRWKAEKQVNPPLSYELAQLYTADLLDVYMGYKVIWDDIHAMLVAIGNGNMQFTKAPAPQPPVIAPPELASDGHPLPARELQPYDVSIPSLDQAVKDCRMLMGRIVTEVQNIAKDPSVATNPAGPVAYIRAMLFRQLLPIPIPQPPPPPAGPTALTTFTDVPFGGLDGLKANGAVDTQNAYIAYPNNGDVPPRVLLGLSKVDMYHGLRADKVTQYRLCTSLSTSNIKADSATISATVVPDPIGISLLPNPATAASYSTKVHALVIPSQNSAIQSGIYKTAWSTHNPPQKEYVVRVYFPQAFTVAPWVAAMLSGFDRECTGNISVFVSAQNIHLDYFDLHIRSDFGDVYQVTVGWIAFPIFSPDICVGQIGPTYGSTTMPATWTTSKTGHVDLNTFPSHAFTKPPKVLIALNGFLYGPDDQIRLQTAASNVTASGFDWSVNAWVAGSQFVDAGVTWIALAQP